MCKLNHLSINIKTRIVSCQLVGVEYITTELGAAYLDRERQGRWEVLIVTEDIG